jgi:hypothetical protein
MDQQQIILELRELEQHLEEVKQKAYSLRLALGQFPAPAPSGASENAPVDSKLLDILNKRRKTFYKNDKK